MMTKKLYHIVNMWKYLHTIQYNVVKYLDENSLDIKYDIVRKQGLVHQTQRDFKI